MDQLGSDGHGPEGKRGIGEGAHELGLGNDSLGNGDGGVVDHVGQ